MAHDRYFEDYEVGSVHEFGGATMTEEEIIAFASRFDPQTFHVDPEAARDTDFGGLIASGWHTAGVMMRMMVDHFSSSTCLGSPGIDELRWLVPVRPGDRLRCRLTVTDAARSRGKPDRGVIHQFVEVVNQDDAVVMRMKGMGIYRCRAAG